MADTTLDMNPEAQVVQSFAIYRSDLERLSRSLLADWWCQEQQREYGLRLDAPMVNQALLNVLAGHLESMLQSWQAEDWLRGDLGTELQAEMERLAGA
jgi:hypothetical protein